MSKNRQFLINVVFVVASVDLIKANDFFLERLKAEADAAKAEADKKKAEKKAKKKKAKEAKEGEEAASSDEGESAPPTEAPPAGNNGLLFNCFYCAVDILDMVGIEGNY